MREILFRGQKVDTKEWVYGNYLKHLPYTPSPIRSKKENEKIEKDYEHYIISDGFSDWNMPRDTVNRIVIPITVGQYTGVKDKKGVMIYKDDILSLCEGWKYKWQVIWYKDAFRMREVSNHRNIKIINSNMKIIGNVHEAKP